ncbi:ArnT family glycosyltransferase [Fluviicola taffensis]|uniref:ArnT family glycosyltransferase n=1 Tax=Fluviicola taffensis TaxID=191579 RepID=UPI0011D21344|nr:glycosyltransferase family 39 protein [Fluviicola taffensis]
MRAKKGTNSIALLLITVLTVILQFKQVNEFPGYIHTWAQNDRLALANGFVRNDLNFFEPQNYILNHQFPSNWTIPSYSTNTAVEFPIHDYIPAVFMKLFGTNEPWIFHVYILLYSIVGFFFLYLLSEKICRSKIKAALVVIFAMTSPVYVYYQGGFLPSIPSIANTLIAFYCYALYFEGGGKKWFRWALFFFTFAVLARFTYVIPFFAVLGFEMIRIIQRKAKFWPNIIGVSVSFLVVFAAQYYNSTLRVKYGSDFLNELLPVDNWEEMKLILTQMWDRWILEYFTIKHYFLILLLAVLGAISLLIKQRNSENRYLGWWLICLFWIIGVCLFWFAMTKQFFAHDYYFLDTFYLPTVLFVMLSLALLPKPQWRYGELIIGILVVYFGIRAFEETERVQKERRVYFAGDHFTGTGINFAGSDEFLTKSGVLREDTILVIHADGPNIPFIKMNRVGLAVVGHTKDDINRGLSWKWDYVVFQKSYFMEDVYKIYPEILNEVEMISTNENLILCKRKQDTTAQSLMNFLDIKNPYKTIKINFETNDSLDYIQVAKDLTRNGNQIGVINENDVYAFSHDFTKQVARNKKATILKIKGKYLIQNSNQATIIVAYSKSNELSYYSAIDLISQLTPNEWMEKEFLIFLPERKSKDEKLSFYIHNPNKNRILIDDFEFQFFKN